MHFLERLRYQKYKPKTGTVSLLLINIKGYDSLKKQRPHGTKKAVAIYNSIIKKTTLDHEGYIANVVEEMGIFTVAFNDSWRAADAAITIQKQLLEAKWPYDILLHRDAVVVFDYKNECLFSGLRANMTITTSPVSEMCTSRHDHLQPPSDGGRVLCSSTFVDLVNKSNKTHKFDSVNDSIFELRIPTLDRSCYGLVVQADPDNGLSHCIDAFQSSVGNGPIPVQVLSEYLVSCDSSREEFLLCNPLVNNGSITLENLSVMLGVGSGMNAGLMGKLNRSVHIPSN